MGEQQENLAGAFSALTPKAKAPVSARVLNTWIAQAQERLSSTGPRVGWLVAATVVSAALQRVLDDGGSPRFLLKGGTLLQYWLAGMSRTTKDIDGLIRGEIDSFLSDLDASLAQPWGPLTLKRGQVEVIDVPGRAVAPRRFDILVELNGITWRRVQVEVSGDEGLAGSTAEPLPAPSLAGFGLPTPDGLTGLSMSYQIAQKIHACTDPHDPPEFLNDRARDVVDLLLLRDLTQSTGHPSLQDVRAAVQDIFTARAVLAEQAGTPPRVWPARVQPYPHWAVSFSSAAESAGLTTTLEEAVEQINAWLAHIEDA